MSREKDPECRAVLLEETPNAIRVKAMAKSISAPSPTWWVPRSQIGYMRKDKTEGGPTFVVFTCPEWLIESKQMWQLVP